MVSISHCLPGSFVDVVFDCDVQFILFIFSVDPESGIPFKLFTEDLQNHTFCLLGGFIVDVGLYCNVNDCVVPLFLRTPLMLAVLGGHTDCVHLLLEKGAWPDAKDKGGSTALHRGVSYTPIGFSHHSAEKKVVIFSYTKPVWLLCGTEERCNIS